MSGKLTLTSRIKDATSTFDTSLIPSIRRLPSKDLIPKATNKEGVSVTPNPSNNTRPQGRMALFLRITPQVMVVLIDNKALKFASLKGEVMFLNRRFSCRLSELYREDWITSTIPFLTTEYNRDLNYVD